MHTCHSTLTDYLFLPLLRLGTFFTNLAIVVVIFGKTAADCPREWRKNNILTRVKLDSIIAALIITGKYNFPTRDNHQLTDNLDVSQFLQVSPHLSTLRPHAPPT